ncbi:MAG: hypothetical protein DLM68_00325 [Hyphomicrobiales bacterium]|nr:MAG: hypothetical protein DLM68_00325 [Hyphomicrobiales bacterium]
MLSAGPPVRRSYDPALTLGYRLPAPLTAQRQTDDIGAALNRHGVNLNQIARHMNAGRGAPPYLSALIGPHQFHPGRDL